MARTDQDAPKHKGISYLLLDMNTPGIEVRPLLDLTNRHTFNQLFFENVRVPRDCLIGELNRGWYIAAATLDFERSGINRVVAGIRIYEELVEYAAQTRHNGGALIDDGSVRHKLAELAIEFQAGRLLSYRVASMQARGQIPNAEASMSKLYGSELQQRARHQLCADGRAARTVLSLRLRPDCCRRHKRDHERHHRRTGPRPAPGLTAQLRLEPPAAEPAPSQDSTQSPPGRAPAYQYLLVVLVALVGGLLGIIGAFFQEAQSTLTYILLPFIGAPLIEEALKPSGIYLALLWWPRALRSQLLTALFCALSGLVFGIIESLVYVTLYVDNPSDEFIVCLGLNQQVIDWAAGRKKLPRASRNFYIAAVVIHGTYNLTAVILTISGVINFNE
ncbi:MAG: PrsW family intramembrane metalloprotease [Chloroflexi bacterium]|nr:MAG: PrsW family intramembrane metalloprotease [Chloroflexota bacterium]